jgi:hypothetical protein
LVRPGSVTLQYSSLNMGSELVIEASDATVLRHERVSDLRSGHSPRHRSAPRLRSAQINNSRNSGKASPSTSGTRQQTQHQHVEPLRRGREHAVASKLASTIIEAVRGPAINQEYAPLGKTKGPFPRGSTESDLPEARKGSTRQRTLLEDMNHLPNSVVLVPANK